MAGFRIGRGRDPRNGRHPAQQPTQAGNGQQGGGPGQAPGAPRGDAAQYGHQVPYAQQPTQAGRGPGHDPYAQPYGAGGPGGGPGGPGGPGGGHGPYGGQQGPGSPWQQSGEGPEYFDDRYDPGRYANNPGHTQQFRVEDEAAYGHDGDYSGGATYAAGRGSSPPPGPKLHWKPLLSGIITRPNATFWQMRDHSVWVTATIVTFLYGLLAVFGLQNAREEVLNSTLSNAIPSVIGVGVAMVVSGLLLGSVTHTLARQFGGDGAWGPTVGLAMLISSLTDAPRLLFALFLGGNATLVQILGWATWAAAAVLLTSMVSRSHDLPWQRALGASSIQLLAWLLLIKLGTL